jgi:hypothetical protein
MHLCTLCILVLVLVLYLMIDIYVNRLSISHRAQAGGNGFSDGSLGFESLPYVFSLMTQIGATLQV